MYINPIEHKAEKRAEQPKRLKAKEGSSFAEHVETLLEVDAVNVTDPHHDEERRNSFGKQKRGQQSSSEFSDGAQDKDQHQLPAKEASSSLGKKGNLNITA